MRSSGGIAEFVGAFTLIFVGAGSIIATNVYWVARFLGALSDPVKL